MHTNWERWMTLKLKTGLQKSMPLLLDQIREIAFEIRGTKLWIAECDGLGTKVRLKWKLANSKGFEGWVVDKMNRKLRGALGELEYEGKPIVIEIHDQHL